MANITRYQSPFGLTPLGEAMDRLMRDAFVGPRAFGHDLAPSAVGLGSNLYETDHGYVLQVALPGVKADDLEMTARANVLTLRGKTEVSQPEGARAIWAGIGTSEFRQQMTLPGEVDAEHATAEYCDGILTLTLPKSERARTRTIRVNGQTPAAGAPSAEPAQDAAAK